MKPSRPGSSEKIETEAHPPAGPQRRGRSRDRSLSKRILQSALEIIMMEGYSRFTIDAVARRAGVPKSTMYRRWPSKGALLADAFVNMVPFVSSHIDSGSLREDLELAFKGEFAVLRDSRARQLVVGILMESQTSVEAAASVRERAVAVRRRSGVLLLQRGIARGEVDPAADLDAALDMAIGAMWYRFLTGTGPLDDTFAHELATQLANNLLPE
jgi:AcrR family transcriptional regulator